MCGIVGLWARNASLAPDILERATLSLAHRGPDDSGTTILRTEKPEPLEIGLGSRRLAILDVSPSGHQPMKDEATGNWIVFTAKSITSRIYGKNWTEKAYGLPATPIPKFCSKHTGAGVSVASRNSEACLPSPSGTRAISVSSSLATPWGSSRFTTSSQPRTFCLHRKSAACWAQDSVTRKLDRAGLLNYLSLGSVYDPNTIVEDLHSVAAGNYWSGNGARPASFLTGP